MKVKIPRAVLLALVSVASTGLITAGFVRAQSANTNSATATTDSMVDQPIATTTTASMTPPQFVPAKGGHVGTNGVKEELLIGDNATKATAAALTAVPGGTILRVETDAEGAVYEAHMTKPDGTMVTVKMDANFTVTGTESGPGRPR